MELFWRLLLGHLVADFTLQTNFISRWKRSSFWGMLAHCGLHPACYAVLTAGTLGEVWVGAGGLELRGWTCIMVLFVVHLLEDQWRVRSILKYKAPDNTLYFMWDQVIHAAVIFAVVPMGMGGLSGPLVPEKWPVLCCLLVLLTDTATVSMYFLEKDLYGGAFPGFDEKYLGMVERLVLALCFLLPRNGWMLAAPLWLAAMYWMRARRLLDLSWFSFGFGSVISVACGFAARAVTRS